MGVVLVASPLVAMATTNADATDYSVATRLEMGIQLAGENQLFWNLPDRFAAEADYATDRHWWEFYLKPGLRVQKALEGSSSIYADFSVVGAGTLERDPFDTGNTGRLLPETAVIGWRGPVNDAGWTTDLSIGAQAYTVGTGMLIANGASNGFERGALKLGPRKAFERTAIARFSHANGFRAEAFYLDPNENPENDSGTRVAGLALDYKPDDDRQAGIAVGRVIESAAPYPKAAPGGIGPPTILEGGRDGLEFLHAHARWPVLTGPRAGWWLGADLALERNDRIDLDAEAWRIEAGTGWPDAPWRPRLVFGLQSFSGDDPSTERLERFDPLFYEGAPGAWGSGTKASMVYINTNVRALQARLELFPTPRDFLTLYLSHLRANELRSPLQFGQATRLDITDGVGAVISGVTHPHLSDDVFLKYTRVLDRHTFLTLGYSASFPGEANKRLLEGRSPTWSGWLVNMVWMY
jgi:hypothetical protein